MWFIMFPLLKGKSVSYNTNQLFLPSQQYSPNMQNLLARISQNDAVMLKEI